MAYHQPKNELYLYGFEANIITCDIASKSAKVLPPTQSFQYYPATIFIDNEFHVIGCDSRQVTCHAVYDPEKNSFKILHEFGTYLANPHVIYSKSRKIMYLLARTLTENFEEKQCVWQCDMNEVIIESDHDTAYKWQETTAELPSFHGLVMVSHEKYVVMFGTNEHKIFVMDLDNLEVTESVMRSPGKARVYTVGCCYDRDAKYNVLLAGFMRRYNGSILNELLKLIENYCCTEYIHVIDGDIGNHWRTNLDDILMNINT